LLLIEENKELEDEKKKLEDKKMLDYPLFDLLKASDGNKDKMKRIPQI
jgi:hypothetical protein